MQISSKSMSAANEEVCQLKNKKREELLAGLPPVFGEILSYLNGLKFASVPDYGKLRGMLTGLMSKNGYQLDYKYDWEYLY